MTSFIPPFPSSPDSQPVGNSPAGPYSSPGHEPPKPEHTSPLLPWEMSGVQPGGYRPDQPRRHPVVIAILTVFTLLPVGLIVAMLVAQLLWNPWRLHAFQATNSGELLAHGVEDIIFEIVGFPLTVCILSCGHVAASLLWSAVPLAKRPKRPKGTPRISLGTRFAAWARAAGAARVVLFVVLLLCLAVAYSTIIMDGSHLVWRVLSPETI